MMIMKFNKVHIATFLFMAIMLTIFVAPNIDTLLAQDELCPTLVTNAVETTNMYCDGIGENQACYGNIQVGVEAYSDFEPLTFSQPGDIANLQYIQSLQLSPMDTTENIWGMARLEVLANLLLEDFETVTLLLFGDTEVDNSVTPTTPVEIAITVNQYVNVRQVPSTNGAVVGTLAPNDMVQALSRLSDNSWLRVQLPTGGVGWVFADLLEPSADISVLRIEEFGAPYYEPMQAFYLRTGTSGTSELACDSAPPSGLLIQTPEGMGEITFLINEVTVDIGSTVYFESPVGGPLSITTIEGRARVTVNGYTSYAFAGTTVTVPMNEDSTPAGIPSAPQPYDMSIALQLPISGLNVQVAVNEPLSLAEIANLEAVTTLPQENSSSCNCDNNATTNNTTGNGNNTASNTGGDNSATATECASFTCDSNPAPTDVAPPTADPNELVTICHIPPGNPANAQTIQVSMSAWLGGHSGHGDTFGPCP